jgi:asparagine synthase (glutamine-hydrolysing)
VIYNLETYDVTTIRASTNVVDGGVIKSMGIKMVLSGEGLMNFGGICISKHQTQENFTENVRKLGNCICTLFTSE